MNADAMVRTEYGEVEGTVLGTCRRWLGIPYAAAPFGPNRMSSPVPHAGWSGVRPAFEYGPTVPKSPYPEPMDKILPEPDIPGEECLNLNIWSPLEGSDHPVLVWIHGGAFVNGSGAVPQYDGSAFARDGVVCVTINYRLAADGFLAVDEDDEQTNIGLRDQIAALRWVRDNIAAFGGDPARVTVAGESAGAMSVGSLLSSPLAAGLVHRAILQSGAGHTAINRIEARTVAAALAGHLGVDPVRSAFAAAEIEDLKRAQRRVIAEVQQIPDPSKWGAVARNMMPFEPLIGDDVLPVLPIDGITSGASTDVDVMIGWNSDEMRLFTVPMGAIDMVDDNLVSIALASVGIDPADAMSVYRSGPATSGSGMGTSAPGDLLAAALTDWMFRIPAIRLAERHVAAGGRAYMYEFTWATDLLDGRLGAAHALEIPFTFDTLGSFGGTALSGADAPQILADEMHGSWVAFIRDGSPGWGQYDPRSRRTMRFGDQSYTIDDPDPQRRELWEPHR